MSLERIATVAVVAAAIAVGGAAVHRELNRGPRTSVRGATISVSRAPEWSEMVSLSIPARGGEAADTVIIFSDLECPVCRRFHVELAQAVGRASVPVQVRFVHFPLPQHRFARPAARAAECAAAQGRFGPFVDAVYAGQDSLGLKSWTAFATAAQVSDLKHFEDCTSMSGTLNRVEEGLQLGNRISIDGTPTVVINGWRFRSAPFVGLDSILRRVADGRAPVDGAVLK